MIVPMARGLAVIRRINWFEGPPVGGPRPYRRPSLALSHQEILARYRGIEGWLWPDLGDEQIHLVSGLAGHGETSRVLRYFQEVRKQFYCDIIYCEVHDFVPTLVSLPAGRRLLGFDYGYLRGEMNCFSVLLNEVVYGTIETMRGWSASLNHNLLLPSLEAVERFRYHREASVLAGEDLEVSDSSEPMQTVAVFDPGSAAAR